MKIKNPIRNIYSYNTYIVDMDGTLYFKYSMQIRMLFVLLGYYIIHPLRIKELFILQYYRKLRDIEELSDNTEFGKIIVSQLSQKFNVEEEKVQSIIDYWILQKPLKILRKCCDKKLRCFLELQKNNLCQVYVYSDYPAVEKCKALNVHPTDVFWPDGERIFTLKPSPTGLDYILRQHRLDRSKVLFIGDRLEKDGLCAKRNEVDYLILNKTKLSRYMQYLKLFKPEAN
ncbi:MAG: hypothetical protein E7627_04755 [Ruminococcaceae bacterium]|nr:hypothetical protein [Oscillospiraceae bacterium]